MNRIEAFIYNVIAVATVYVEGELIVGILDLKLERMTMEEDLLLVFNQ